MKSYILLVIVWLLVLASIVYFWVRYDTQAHWVLWVILATIPLVPLADKLKIGNWFEFRKKTSDTSDEVATRQDKIVNIGNLNLEITSKEAAETFAQSIQLAGKVDYPPQELRDVSTAEEDSFFSKNMSPTDRQRFFFIQAADKVIASATPLMRILYAVKIAKQTKKEPTGKQVYSKPTKTVIEELRQDREDLHGSSGDQFGQYLQTIGNLIKLRENIYKMNTEPPSYPEGQKLIKDARTAISYFSGYISVGATLISAPQIIQSSIQPDKGSKKSPTP